MTTSPSPSNPRLQRILAPLASLVGILALGEGIYSLVDPVSFARTSLGFPVTSASSPAVPFVSFVGARNLSFGITVLVLQYTGQRRAVGTAIMCLVAAAGVNSWICARNGAEGGKALGHAVMAPLFGLLGRALYWS